jgi:hypothetical protein
MKDFRSCEEMDGMGMVGGVKKLGQKRREEKNLPLSM